MRFMVRLKITFMGWPASYLNLRPPMNSATDLTVNEIFGPNGISAVIDPEKLLPFIA